MVFIPGKRAGVTTMQAAEVFNRIAEAVHLFNNLRFCPRISLLSSVE